MASTSSLLRGAASVRDQLSTYQDSLMATQYKNSAYTDDALKDYSDYLNGRIDSLNKAGGVSNMSKALSLSNALDTAIKSNISATIQRESIQVLAGNATPTDKYTAIVHGYVRAVNNGDMTLAQSLESQAYSLSQTIQLQRQQAADAAATLGKSNASHYSSSEKGVVTSLIESLRQFNNDFAHAGQKNAQSVLDKYVKAITPQLNSLGVHLKPGMSLNAFSVAQGVAQAVTQAYTLAHDAVAPYDPGAADSIAQTAANFLGQGGQGGKIPTLGGTMSATELDQAVVDPNRFSYKADPDYVGNKGGTQFANQNPQVGFKFDYTKDSSGNPVGVIPVFSQNAWVNVPSKVNDVAQQLGLQIIGGANGNTIEVAAKKDSPDWVKKILQGNSTTHLVEDADGNINFEADSTQGNGMAKYLIQGNISGGKYNVYEWGANGYTNIGQIGQAAQTGGKSIGINNRGSGDINVPSYLPNGHLDQLKGVFGNLNDFGGMNTSKLLENASAKQEQVSAATLAAAKAMLAYKPPELPNIALTVPKTTPNISQPAKTSVAMPTYPISQPTVNPQRPTVNPQSPGGINLQGGGFNLQGGGGGIRL